MSVEVNLYHGDCLTEMDKIPDHSVDAIIADWPYGTTQCAWDTVIPFAPMWVQCKRVIKPKGAIVLFGSQPFTSALVMSNVEWFRYEWIWEKDKGANFLQGNIQPLKAHENLLVFAESSPLYYPQKIKTQSPRKPTNGVNNKARFEAGLTVSRFVSSLQYEGGKLLPRTVQYFARNIPKGGTLHPTQKPVALLEYLIRTYTNEGETVLDNTMGSGTTGVACVRTSRSFIGIELDKHYYDTAVDRIESTRNQVIQLSMLKE